jgi:hypothetical protein
VGPILAETWAWHEAKGSERKKSYKVIETVAQTNEAIFHICWRLK